VTTGSARIADALAGVTHPDPVIRLALIASHLWCEVANIRVMAVLAVRGPLKVHTAAGLAPLRTSVVDAIVEGQATGAIRTDVAAPRLARLVEDSALSVLDESVEHPMSDAEGHRLAVLVTLGAIGFGWRDAGAFVDANTELFGKDSL
jgi:hypothetical protein